MASNQLGRLRKGREFDSVYAEGTVIGGPLFVVRAKRGTESGARWGFAVGKKLAPKAVVRNRVRRRLREAVRSVDAPRGMDVVLTARPRAIEAPLQLLEAELQRSLAKLAEGLE